MVEKRDGQTRLLGKWHNEIVSGRNVHECGFSLKGLLSQELFALCLHRAYLYVFVRFGCVSLLLVSLKWVINISHLIQPGCVECEGFEFIIERFDVIAFRFGYSFLNEV